MVTVTTNARGEGNASQTRWGWWKKKAGKAAHEGRRKRWHETYLSSSNLVLPPFFLFHRLSCSAHPNPLLLQLFPKDMVESVTPLTRNCGAGDGEGGNPTPLSGPHQERILSWQIWIALEIRVQFSREHWLGAANTRGTKTQAFQRLAWKTTHSAFNFFFKW